MLRVCCFALCLAIVSSSAINNKRQIGNAFDYEVHPAVRHRLKFSANRRMPEGPPKNTPLPLECQRKNPKEKCRQATPPGGPFLTNLEGTSLGPGFPPKPVGYVVRPNISREEVSSTSAPTKIPLRRFLVDDVPPMPPPPLRRRPLPKGRLRRPLLNSVEKMGLSQEKSDPIILGPLFYEDLHNPESTTQVGENRQGTSQESSIGSGERNRALLDSFNELDHPDPKLLSQWKQKLYPKYYAEKRNSELKGKDEAQRPTAENEKEDERIANSEEANNSKEEDDNAEKSSEEERLESVEEAPPEETSEDYESSTEEGDSVEEHRPHHSAEEESKEEEQEEEEGQEEEQEEGQEEGQEEEQDEEKEVEGEEEEEEPVSDNQENSEEDENHPKQHSEEEEKQVDSEEENLHPNTLENNGQNISGSRNHESPESGESAEEGENANASGEENQSDEESTEEISIDYSEGNNDIDSSAPSEETYHPSAEESSSDESNESAQNPTSSSEDSNEVPPNSNESSDEINEDYDSKEQQSHENHSPEHQSQEQHSQEQHSQEQHSQEQHSQEQQSQEQHSHEENSQEEHPREHQSEENPEKPFNEYEEENEEEKPPDYYDLPDYEIENPEKEYEDVFPQPEEGTTKKPQVYYKKRPATFYYIVGGPEVVKKDPNKEPLFIKNGSKPLDYEDNKIKQSEEVDSSTPSAEDHPSSSSDESFSMNFESFDLDSVMKTPEVGSDGKTTKSPVAIITNTTPQTGTTKCDDDDAKKNEDPESQKKLKTPLGTAKPNTLQPGDVVSFTRPRPINIGLSPTVQTTTSTFRPATISAIGIIKPGGSIIAKVVSPTLQVLSSTSSPTKSDDAQMEAPTKVPWKTLLAAREATALTYLKPPPLGQTQTWFMGHARAPRFIDFLARPL